jgi:hypothetical protein
MKTRAALPALVRLISAKPYPWAGPGDDPELREAAGVAIEAISAEPAVPAVPGGPEEK